jgi:hypothetical protein
MVLPLDVYVGIVRSPWPIRPKIWPTFAISAVVVTEVLIEAWRKPDLRVDAMLGVGLLLASRP